jgi:hypothetical protein
VTNSHTQYLKTILQNDITTIETFRLKRLFEDNTRGNNSNRVYKHIFRHTKLIRIYGATKNKHISLLDKMKIIIDFIGCQTANKIKLVSLDDFLQIIPFSLPTHSHYTVG